MSFDEIQSIWNSQDSVQQEVDQAELTAWIRNRIRAFERIVNVTEICMAFTLLFVAAMFMRDPIMQGHDRILIVPGLISLAAAIFIWTGRIARRKRSLKFDDSLVGLTKQSILAVDYQVRRMRGFLWWFAGPMALGLLIGLIIVDPSKRYLFVYFFVPAFLISMGLTYWQIRREIRLKLEPERKRLEQLLANLEEPSE